MKTINYILTMALAFTLAACSGGGGGGGGGPTPPGGGGGGGGATPGSAGFVNLGSTASDLFCEKNGVLISPTSTTYSTQASCEANAGTWTVNSVAVGDRCEIGTTVYTRVGQGSWTLDAEDISSCEAFGGTVVAGSNQNVGSCSIAPGVALTCTEQGGTEVSLVAVTGEIDDTEGKMKAGTNTLTGEDGITGLSCKIQDGSGKSCIGTMATETPYIFSATNKIKLGVDRWTTTIYVRTGTTFSDYTGSPMDKTSFNVSLPVATDGSDGLSTSEYTFPTLYYAP